MAWEIDVEAGRRMENLPLSKLPRTYRAGNNIIDSVPATTLPTMQDAQIRNRLQRLQSPRDVDQNGGGSMTSEIDLTPTSSEASELNQEISRPVSWSTAALQKLRRSISTTNNSCSSKDDAKEQNQKHGYDQIKHEKVDQFPRGFPRLAAFQSSDDDFMIFRGFKRLHNRILLRLEVEITLLEEALDKLDSEDDGNDKMRYRLGHTKHKEGWSTTQLELLDQIRDKLSEYDEILLKHSQIQRLGRPPPRNHRSLFDWVYSKQELAIGYFNFIFHENDFVVGSGGSDEGTRGSRTNYFEERIRSYFGYWPDSFFKRFVRSEPLVTKPGEPVVDRYSSTKLSVLSNILLVSLAMSILLIPIYLLFLVNMTRFEMAMTVSAFLLLFCVSICSTTNANIQEVLMGSAAYGAVLATFLGNMNNGCSV